MCEQVPSWRVTVAMLAGWGFPVEKRDKCAGMGFVVSEGMTFGRALHAAWAAGHVRIAVTPESVVEERRAAFHARLAQERRTAVESLEFFRANGMLATPIAQGGH